MKSFRNLYAILLRHLPHTADVPPPFSPLPCKRHCSSNQMMQRKDFLPEPSTRNLLQKFETISKELFSSTASLQTCNYEIHFAITTDMLRRNSKNNVEGIYKWRNHATLIPQKSIRVL